MRSYYMLSPIELMKPIDWYMHTHIHAETHTHTCYVMQQKSCNCSRSYQVFLLEELKEI
jgi:hypothetical protein